MNVRGLGSPTRANINTQTFEEIARGLLPWWRCHRAASGEAAPHDEGQ